MPPKKPAADSADPPAPSSSDAPVKETKSDAGTLRKLAAHPSTAIMVKEALKELDSRKGVSSQAIQNYIKQQYPSVDLVRLKHLVRRALKKGLETGTLVRPANSTVSTGATGKFRLAPKVKEAKSKTENTDPNVPKEPKAAKDGAKKTKKAAGATKKKNTASEKEKSEEEPKPPKKSKKDDGAASSKAAPAKKPKAKKAAEKGDSEEATAPAKPEAKAPTKPKAKKTTKAAKASQTKAAEASSDVPTAKATGQRRKKSAE
ncbi:linker histone H1M isoform X1 [Sparus aurata]|uniref:linker histone H1M isoform X1 n=1 Tax=Sparus aurata TaxID=8175 RepID=UPI0011C0DB80|nr:protein B4-like isoform X1 [Sparus aurata]